MSLNKFTGSGKGQDLKLEIGALVVDCETMNCTTMNFPVGGDIQAHDLTVSGVLTVDNIDIAGNNYATPDLGQPNYALHTDGAGTTFWSPDDTGSASITYSGVPPTILGQLLVFDNTEGGLAKQSVIVDDGANLNLNNHNITNANTITTENITINNTFSLTGAFNTDTINEATLNNGVRIETVVLKDGFIDGVSMSVLNGTVSTNFGNIDTNTINIGTNTTNIGFNTDDIGINTINIGTNTTDIGTNSGDIFTNTTNIGTNVTNIGTNSTDIGNLNNDKLDKNGSANLTISSAMPILFLKDTVSTGGCNGILCLKDSLTNTIAEMSAPNGYFKLKSKANVNNVISPNLSLQNDINGTPQIGAGGSVLFHQEVRPDVYFDAGIIESELTNIGLATESANINIGTLTNGVNNKQLIINNDGIDTLTGNTTTTQLKTNSIVEKTLNNGVNIETVVIKDGLVDGVDISAFNTDYNLKVNQAVKTTSNPSFNSVVLSTALIIDEIKEKVLGEGVKIQNVFMKDNGSIELKDTFNTGACNRHLRMLDSIDAEIVDLKATNGYLELATKDNINNAISKNLTIKNNIDGIPAIGCGGELTFNQEIRSGAYFDACSLASLVSTIGVGLEKSHMIFKTLTNGVNTEKLRLSDNLTLYEGVIKAPDFEGDSLNKYDTAGAVVIGNSVLSSSVDISKTSATTTVKGDLTIDEDFTYQREYFNLYTINGTSTTPVLIGQLTKILFGVVELEAQFLSSFSLNASNQIIYNGTRTKKIHINCRMTISASEKDVDLQMLLQKNGTTIINSIVGEQRIIDKNWHFDISFCGIETFSTSDTIEFFCLFQKNADIFIHNLNIVGQALPN